MANATVKSARRSLKFMPLSIFKHEGYVVIVCWWGVYLGFNFGLAQSGDRKGSMTVFGPGVGLPVTVGNIFYALNLSCNGGSREPLRVLRSALRQPWRNKEMTAEMAEAVELALEPYGRFVSRG
jgi:hypothetical protein